MGHYITGIYIDGLRHLSDIYIELDPSKRANLLLTGKNGSGKTTVLRAVRDHLRAINDGMLYNVTEYYPQKMAQLQKQMDNAANETEKYDAQLAFMNYAKRLQTYGKGVRVVFNDTTDIEALFKTGRFVTAFYGAGRRTSIEKQKEIKEIVLEYSYSINENPGDVLLNYLVHLKTQQAYARNEGDMPVVQMIDQWFARFEHALKALLDNKSIQLKYNYKNYNFQIIEEGREPFGFDQLSDGYSAAVQIAADLILRMEQNWLQEGRLSSYDMEGVVLIDELETHLHIGMQKTILAFLTEFFPNIQFIVSTHSPYILNSIENCVIYDLENRIRMENLSGYPAEGIVEGYFGVESYSKCLMEKVKRYEALTFKKGLTSSERAERAKILAEMQQVSWDLAKEAKSAFEEIEMRRKQDD